ncbi:ATP-binding cassette domain-containing protein [Actinoallomurus acanthiterrae]
MTPVREAIVTRGLTKVYGDLTAVDGVDLTVRTGEMFAFLGPNGAGKSTTIAMLTTMARPTAGCALVAGADVLTHPAAVRRRIGVVFQEPTVDDDLTAEENLSVHATLYGMPRVTARARITEMLDLVGLAAHRRTRPATFSGGMTRRLEIARGLLHRPRVLFLDEPTLGLDPHARTRVWDHLRRLRRQEPITIFLTTHYLEEAEHCDRMAIIDHGRIVVCDTPTALKAALSTDHVHLRTSDDTLAQAALARELGLAAALRADGLHLRLRGADTAVPRLCAALSVPIASIEVIHPSLDDVFLHYTGHAVTRADR